ARTNDSTRIADYSGRSGERSFLVVCAACARRNGNRCTDCRRRGRVNHTINGANLTPVHFGWEVSDSVATITLNRPERKNPLTLESYRELTDPFLALPHANDRRALVITGAGENFSSGGDVHDIIGRLVEMKQAG